VRNIRCLQNEHTSSLFSHSPTRKKEKKKAPSSFFEDVIMAQKSKWNFLKTYIILIWYSHSKHLNALKESKFKFTLFWCSKRCFFTSLVSQVFLYVYYFIFFCLRTQLLAHFFNILQPTYVAICSAHLGLLILGLHLIICIASIYNCGRDLYVSEKFS